MSANDLFISPSKISKQGKRYYIEIPKSMADVAEQLHGKPISVSINLLGTRSSQNKSWSAQVFGEAFDAAGNKVTLDERTIEEINKRYGTKIALDDQGSIRIDQQSFTKYLEDKHGKKITSEIVSQELGSLLRCFEAKKET